MDGRDERDGQRRPDAQVVGEELDRIRRANGGMPDTRGVQNVRRYEWDEEIDFDAQGKVVASEADYRAVAREYARKHGLTAAQMLHLPTHEAAELCRLAHANAFVRWFERQEAAQAAQMQTDPAGGRADRR